jgi:Sec7-like guanine-nucleotide exchange factor
MPKNASIMVFYKKEILLYEDKKYFLDVSSETVAIGYKLILRLNPLENESIITIIKKLNKIISGNEEIESNEFMQNLDALVEESHKVLKQEWEKVKKEARYKKPVAYGRLT